MPHLKALHCVSVGCDAFVLLWPGDGLSPCLHSLNHTRTAPHLAVRNALEASTASCIFSVCISGTASLMRNKCNDRRSCCAWANLACAPDFSQILAAWSSGIRLYSKCLQNLIIFTITLWILPAIAPQRMGKEVKESFQLLDKLSIESWKFERLENDLLFAGGDYLKIPSLIMFGWPAQWTGPRHPCRVHGARTVLE